VASRIPFADHNCFLLLSCDTNHDSRVSSLLFETRFMNNAEMKQKIDSICKECGITVKWIEAGDNCANRCQKKVWIREIADIGDFAVALHEIRHAMCDPCKEPASHRERLDADTNAWLWALERNSNNFDVEGWKRLHKSLHQYYVGVMDSNHPAHKLLVKAEEQDAGIQPRLSNYFTGPIKFGGRKGMNPKK
jgi:hypothetical protein